MKVSKTFHRSFQDTYRRCQRLAWYTYLQDGTGVEPEELSLGLHFGSSGHSGMEVLFKTGGNVDAALEAALTHWRAGQKGRPPFKEAGAAQNPMYFQSEQEALLTAFIIAFYVQFWETFNNEYGVESVEKEVLAQASSRGCGQSTCSHCSQGPIESQWCTTPVSYRLQARCDLVIRSRYDGAIYIPDWKFVKDAKDWGTKFMMEPQTWAQQYATEWAMGERPAGSVYWAFIKGDRRKGQQLSYLIYGYKKLLPTNQWTYSCEYESGKGWAKFAVWEEEGFGQTPRDRLRFWVNWLPEEVRAAQFCQSPPVLWNWYLISQWLRESSDIMDYMTATSYLGMNGFHRSPSHWNCNGCWAKPACVIGEPYQNGRPRISHHPDDPGLTIRRGPIKVVEP